MGKMIVMNDQGDSSISWDKDDKGSVAVAEQSFNVLRSQGNLPFTVTSEGRADKVLDTFDPAAEEIIFTPPMAGG